LTVKGLESFQILAVCICGMASVYSAIYTCALAVAVYGAASQTADHGPNFRNFL